MGVVTLGSYMEKELVMIEILSKADVAMISDSVLRAGVLKEFDRLPDDYEYPQYGYFIVIESRDNIPALEQIISQYTARSLHDSVEMVEAFDGYVQVVLVLEADFGVSLFLKAEVMSLDQLKELFEI